MNRSYVKLICIASGCCIIGAIIICSTFVIKQNALPKLPHFYSGNMILDQNDDTMYRVRPYILAAKNLQSMGRAAAERYMMDYAKKGYDSDQIYILCRILYVKSGRGDFNEPKLGKGHFVAENGGKEFPLQPIEIVDGVPFLIVYDYAIFGGMPDSPAEYLDYCRENCGWNTYNYRVKSESELQSALNKIVNSPKWKRPLGPREKGWLTAQIQ